MAKIKILSNDPLLKIMKQKESQNELRPLMAPFGGLKYSIEVPSSETKTSIEEQNGITYNEYTFTFSLENRVNTTQNTSYNAVGFFNTPQLLSETGLKSIYQLTPAQMQDIQEDSQDGVFVTPIDDLEELTKAKDTTSISLNENLDKSEIYETKNHFPFHVDFRFSSSENSFYELLVENNAYELMIEAFNNLQFTDETFDTNMGEMVLKTAKLDNVFSSANPVSTSWQVLHVPDSEYEWMPEYDTLEAVLLRSKINDFVRENAPRYQSIVSGDKDSHYQIICYKIEKFKPEQSAPIQVFYVPASNQNRDFIDTQVNFGAEYNYKIQAIGLAIATSYAYTVTSAAPFKSLVEIAEKPEAKIFQIQLSEQNIKIQGICPTKPEVSFLNRSNEEKKMRFYFEPSVFEEREEFIPVQESDEEFHASSKMDSDNKTIFRLGQDTLTYQIYKLNQRPKSYSDFADALFVEVESSDRSSSEVYETFLTPNKKFYFMFRTRNGFNLFSNPTPIYEVELTQDSDETRVVVKTIDLSEDIMTRTKTFGRFLRIYPAFDQIILNEYSDISENLPLDQNISNQQEAFRFNNKKYYLGKSENPIWGKKFKFRVRSRNTGKVVDINVDFELDKKQTEEDF